MAKPSATAALAARLRDAAALIELIERMDAGEPPPATPHTDSAVVPPARPLAPTGPEPAGRAVKPKSAAAGPKSKRGQKAKAAMIELRRDPRRKNREIADVVGCSPQTVAEVRRSMPAESTAATSPAGPTLAASNGDGDGGDDDKEEGRQQRQRSVA